MSFSGFLHKLPAYIWMQVKMILARLQAHNGLVTVQTKNGYLMQVNVNDTGLGRQLIVNGERETLATEFYDQHVEDGMTVLECGANIGYYTLLTLVKRPDCRAICFEPVTENVDLLKRNLALNNVTDRAEVFPYACGDKDHEATFYISQLSNAGNMVAKHDNTVEERTVRVVKLDDFLTGRKKIDYLRMDVEGYEHHIIKGMHQLLDSGTLKKLFIEIHPVQLKELGTNITDFITLLAGHGYQFTRAIYEGAAIIAPKSNHVFTDLASYQSNPMYETRSAQVFFDRAPRVTSTKSKK